MPNCVILVQSTETAPRCRHHVLAAAWALLTTVVSLPAQTIHVSVDVAQDRVAVSPYLYGKNDGVGTPGSPLNEAGWQLFRDAGVKMLRMHGGNNGTKYNWQKKLTSHPDWYNNVYASNDWDYRPDPGPAAPSRRPIDVVLPTAWQGGGQHGTQFQ